MWEGTGRSRGKGDCNKNILYEKRIYFNKRENFKKLCNINKNIFITGVH